jgi:hypothetical protein
MNILFRNILWLCSPIKQGFFTPDFGNWMAANNAQGGSMWSQCRELVRSLNFRAVASKAEAIQMAVVALAWAAVVLATWLIG